MKIAVDFDGVVCQHKGVVRGHDFSEEPPVEGARDALDLLWDLGHTPYILTARPETEHEDIQIWLDLHGFSPIEVTNIKKDGTKVIIDDRAIRFKDWVDTCKYFN